MVVGIPRSTIPSVVYVQEGSPVANMLHDAGYQSEPDYYSKNTLVFSFRSCKVRPSQVLKSLCGTGFNLILLQREWADNAVSNTLYFRPAWPLTAVYPFETTTVDDLDTVWRIETTDDVIELNRNEYRIEQGITRLLVRKFIKVYGYDKSHEEDNISDVISMIAPHTKSVSLLPHTAKGVYPQMPEEGITPEEYRDMLENVEEIDWTQLRDSDGQDEKYCDGDRCEVPCCKLMRVICSTVLIQSFPGRKLSYDYLASKCGRTFKSIVYGAQMGNEADYFIKKVQSYGFATKFKKPKTFGDGARKADWDIGITVDAFRILEPL